MGSNLLLSLFTKEWPERTSSLSKEWWERFALDERVIHSFKEWFTSNLFFSPCFSQTKEQIALCKRGNHSFQKSEKSDLLFLKSELLFCVQKRGIHTKNQRADSQPCLRPGSFNATYQHANKSHVILHIGGHALFPGCAFAVHAFQYVKNDFLLSTLSIPSLAHWFKISLMEELLNNNNNNSENCTPTFIYSSPSSIDTSI